MSLREETKQDLLKELQSLEEEEKSLAEEARRIERRGLQTRRKQRALRIILDREHAEDEDSKSTESSSPEDGDLAGVSFREAWRKVLADHPKGMKPSAVAKEMEARGYSDDTKTPLSTRVGNDLWKQANRGDLEKSKGGKYRLPFKES